MTFRERRKESGRPEHEKSSGFSYDSIIKDRTAKHRNRGNNLQRPTNDECGLWRKMKWGSCISESLLLTEGCCLRRGGDWIRGHEGRSVCSRKPERSNQTVSSWCKMARLRRAVFEMPRPKGLIEWIINTDPVAFSVTFSATLNVSHNHEFH